MCIKKITGVLRAISGSPHPKNFTSAIIAAAGMSERFGGDVTKQMTMLCGFPVLAHTIRAFQSCDCIHEIVIVAKRNEIATWEKLCRDYNFDKVTKIIPGGYTRQESVMNGLDAVVFTAGVGENDTLIRNGICQGMEWLGIDFDGEANASLRGVEAFLTKPESKTKVLLIPTNEELMIAMDTAAIVKG